MRIHKYPLTCGEGELAIRIHAGFEPLHVNIDRNGQPALWAKVDVSQKLITAVFLIVATGAELPLGCNKYLGTFVKDWFVGHVFLK